MRLNIKTFWCCSEKYRRYKLFLCEAYSALSLRSDSAIYYFLTQYIFAELLQCFSVPGMVLEPRGHLSWTQFSKKFHICQMRQRIRRKQTLECIFFHAFKKRYFQGKPFNITIMQVYAPTRNAEEAEVEWFCEDLQDLLELTSKKEMSFSL